MLRRTARGPRFKQRRKRLKLLFVLVVILLKIIIKVVIFEVILVEFVVLIDLIDPVDVVHVIDASTSGLGLPMTIRVLVAFGATGQLHLLHFLAAVIEIAQITTHLPASPTRRDFSAGSRASIRACNRPVEVF